MHDGSIIVGLGNPGEEYAYTPHNAGRLAVEEFARLHGARSFRKERMYCAHITDVMLSNAKGSLNIPITLVLPDTYMNDSGKSVAPFLSTPEDATGIIVVHDDIDLPIGGVRISYDRGTGGHKGVASIISETGTKKFIRVRIGVAPVNIFGKMRKPSHAGGVSAYVLTPVPAIRKKKFDEGILRAQDALDTVIREGVSFAMNMFNQP